MGDLLLDSIQVIQTSDHYRNVALNDFNSKCSALVEDGWVPISTLQYDKATNGEHTFTQQFARAQ